MIYPQSLTYQYQIVDGAYSRNRKENFWGECCKSEGLVNLKCEMPKEGGYIRLRLETFIDEEGYKCKVYFSSKKVHHIGQFGFYVHGETVKNSRIFLQWEGTKDCLITDFGHLWS